MRLFFFFRVQSISPDVILPSSSSFPKATMTRLFSPHVRGRISFPSFQPQTNEKSSSFSCHTLSVPKSSIKCLLVRSIYCTFASWQQRKFWQHKLKGNIPASSHCFSLKLDVLPTENQLYFRCEKHPPFPYKQSKYSTNILAESIRHTLMVISPPLEREEPWLSPPPPRLNAARDVHCSGSRRRRPITYTECVKGQVCFLCNIDSEVCACSTFTVSTNPKGGQTSKKNICISLLGNWESQHPLSRAFPYQRVFALHA